MVWSSARAPVYEPDSTLPARALSHLESLTPNTREALLLHAIQGFTTAEIASIMGVQTEEAADFIDIARREMENSVCNLVLVIEDDAIIAMDISATSGRGHTVTGLARTRSEAIHPAAARRPDLILADIQVADQPRGLTPSTIFWRSSSISR